MGQQTVNGLKLQQGRHIDVFVLLISTVCVTCACRWNSSDGFCGESPEASKLEKALALMQQQQQQHWAEFSQNEQ